MKKRSGKNLIRFFYHLLVVLVMGMPLLSGLVRIIYIQANQNANESYYGETINQSIEYQVYGNNNLEININYTWAKQPFVSSNGGLNNIIYYLNTFSINGVEYDYDRFRFYRNGDNVISMFLYNSGSGSYVRELLSSSNDLVQFNISNIVVTTGNVVFADTYLMAYYFLYNNYSYLDNAFDYSIWKTMDDFTFHSDFRFTDIANGILMTFDNSNLYIQYINFYINWVLTCAVISFAPYVLLSFYHLAIHLVDKFTRKGEDL